MGTDAPTIVFIPVHCAPKKAPCSKCGKLGKRKRTCTREVRTVAFKAVAYILEHFSGTLCVDDLHLGRFTLLLATDPLNDLPVAFALVAANDQNHMWRFLKNLRNWGLDPHVVVTDGSNLYPAVLAELWPESDHQLCVFHVTMAYLNNPISQRVRTNNHVERTNRMFRLLEKVRYKWRSRKTLVRFVVLTLDDVWNDWEPPMARGADRSKRVKPGKAQPQARQPPRRVA
jgi:hypothetical protein